MNKELKI